MVYCRIWGSVSREPANFFGVGGVSRELSRLCRIWDLVSLQPSRLWGWGGLGSCRVWCLGLRVWGSRVEGLGFRFQG